MRLKRARRCDEVRLIGSDRSHSMQQDGGHWRKLKLQDVRCAKAAAGFCASFRWLGGLGALGRPWHSCATIAVTMRRVVVVGNKGLAGAGGKAGLTQFC